MISKQPLILVFAISFTLLTLAPPLFDQPFYGYTLIHWGDVLDIFTPLVLLPLYWVLFTDAGRLHRVLTPVLIFTSLGALWAQGQGMHLAANSISNLLGAGGTELHALIHFYDEVLSHYLWHLGIIGLSILLVVVSTSDPVPGAVPHWRIIIPSAVLYGFTYFAAINEGGTVPLGLPAAALIVVGLLIGKRNDIRTKNLIAFFFLAYLLSLLLFTAWFARWGGFPEFSEVGLL